VLVLFGVVSSWDNRREFCCFVKEFVITFHRALSVIIRKTSRLLAPCGFHL